jgi:hypothetical protein
MKAYELFCLRGCDHGTEVEDWVSAKRDLSSESDDVAIEKSDGGLDISITGERAPQGLIFLSVAPSSLLILWTGGEANSSDEDANICSSILTLVFFPELADPARAVVTYRDDRVHLHLAYVGIAHSREMHTLETSTADAADNRPGSSDRLQRCADSIR